MNTCRNYTEDISVLAAAILHDVLEDTSVSKEELLEFLNGVMNSDDANRTMTLVVELTDIYTKKNYPRINRRVRKQKEAERLSLTSVHAQTIKYADILDNTDVTSHDPDFAIVYLRESEVLLDRMENGHPELREKARIRVQECLRSLQVDRPVLR
jgi:guanosine-3',5'-bis(diphosphate) 3'-pyrophosphohydrolase